MQIPQDVTTELAKASPAVGVGALTIFGVAVPDIVQLATLVYVIGLIIQQGYRLRRWYVERRRRKAAASASPEG